MSGLDRSVLAEKAAAVKRHLERVAARLPADPGAFQPMTDASDAVVLHLWQAVQLVIDLAMAACFRLGQGTPETYAEAFRKLAVAGVLEGALAERLVRAAGFRNLVVDGYERLDMVRLHGVAQTGPADLVAFLAALRDKALDV